VEVEPVGVPDAKPVPVKLASATADVNPPETVLARSSTTSRTAAA
jgi:hypothetical protein